MRKHGASQCPSGDRSVIHAWNQGAIFYICTWQSSLETFQQSPNLHFFGYSMAMTTNKCNGYLTQNDICRGIIGTDRECKEPFRCLAWIHTMLHFCLSLIWPN